MGFRISLSFASMSFTCFHILYLKTKKEVRFSFMLIKVILQTHSYEYVNSHCVEKIVRQYFIKIARRDFIWTYFCKSIQCLVSIKWSYILKRTSTHCLSMHDYQIPGNRYQRMILDLKGISTQYGNAIGTVRMLPCSVHMR